MQILYNVVTYDEDENKWEKTFHWRDKAMEFAKIQRWATINIIYS